MSIYFDLQMRKHLRPIVATNVPQAFSMVSPCPSHVLRFFLVVCQTATPAGLEYIHINNPTRKMKKNNPAFPIVLRHLLKPPNLCLSKLLQACASTMNSVEPSTIHVRTTLHQWVETFAVKGAKRGQQVDLQSRISFKRKTKHKSY